MDKKEWELIGKETIRKPVYDSMLEEEFPVVVGWEYDYIKIWRNRKTGEIKKTILKV